MDGFARALLEALADDDDDRDWACGKIRKGSRVRVRVAKPRFGWGKVEPSSVGIAAKSKGNGVVTVNFPEVDGWSSPASELEIVREAEMIQPGATVCVKSSVLRPKLGWGSADDKCVGKVVKVRYDGVVIVDWGKSDDEWKGALGDLEVTSKRLRTPGVCTVLILDLSSSMAGSVGDLKAGVKDFIRGCRKNASAGRLQPENIAIVTYNSSAQILCSFTSDYDYLERVVDSLPRPTGLTAMAGAIEKAGNLSLEDGTPYEIQIGQNHVGMNPRMILFTDGVPVEDRLTCETAKDKVIKMATMIGPEGRDKGCVSRVIPTTCVSVGRDVDNELMKDIARLSGAGQYYKLSDMSELSDFFDKQVALLAAVGLAEELDDLRQEATLRRLLADVMGARAASMMRSEITGMMTTLVGMGVLAQLAASDSDSEPEPDEPRAMGGIKRGARVRVKVSKPAYGWGDVLPQSVGIVKKFNRDGDVLVDFPEKDGFISKPDELAVDHEAERIQPGVRVRVKPSVSLPKFNWGSASPSSVGHVKEVKYDGKVVINFPEDDTWHGVLGELEVVDRPAALMPPPSAGGEKSFCTSCGTKYISSSQKFCGACGSKR